MLEFGACALNFGEDGFGGGGPYIRCGIGVVPDRRCAGQVLETVLAIGVKTALDMLLAL